MLSIIPLAEITVISPAEPKVPNLLWSHASVSAALGDGIWGPGFKGQGVNCKDELEMTLLKIENVRMFLLGTSAQKFL